VSVASPGAGADRAKWMIALGTAVSVVLLDQWTKVMVVERMALYESIPVVDGFFALTYVRNTGAAFGILADRIPTLLRAPFFLAVSGVALLMLGWFLRGLAAERAGLIAACGGVLGGAIGNMIDRVRLGEVIDFLDVYVGAYHWPTFNVADAAITVGVIALCIDTLRGDRGEHSADPPATLPE
jgi:signal peptidase II